MSTQLTDHQIELTSQILTILVQYGIPAAEALVRSVKALFGHDLSAADTLALINGMAEDARIRAILGHADAKGDGA